jgi:hypothetical protein
MAVVFGRAGAVLAFAALGFVGFRDASFFAIIASCDHSRRGELCFGQLRHDASCRIM